MNAEHILTRPDGRDVEVLLTGDPRGRPVLFLPGCPDSRWAAWPGGEPARRLGVRLVAVNRPGYGRSSFAAGTSHLSVADDLVAVADELGVDTFALLGMSLGGVTALATAVRHPERVSAVTTVSTPGNVAAMDPPHHRDGLTAEQAELLRRVRLGSVADAVELLRPEFEAWRARIDPDDADDERLAAKWVGTSQGRDAELLRAVPVAVSARSVREALTNADGYLQDAALMLRPWQFDVGLVRSPVVVRHGGQDDSASPRNARWLLAEVPTARGGVDPAATHLSALHDHWDQVLKELLSNGQL